MDNKEYNDFWRTCSSLYDTFEKRSKGELPEMESSKSLARLLKQESGDREISILDAGCGMGHYYVSIKKNLPNAVYEGCDVTTRYIEGARKIWKDEPVNFTFGSIGDLPYPDRSFDYVVCNNVILHIPPPVYSSLRDLIRVAKSAVIIRTPISNRTYFIKELRNYDDDLGRKNGHQTVAKDIDDATTEFNYLNLYEKRHLTEIAHDAANKLGISISIDYVRDTEFSEFDNANENESRTATRVINGMQISGPIILDWHYIIIKLSH
jgi:ubiquinone/menaquinone biosynthesis C-methylase UbiE